MGKSPGRWIKNLLLGKKSSKFNLPKGKEKLYVARKEKGLDSSQFTVSDFSAAPQSISVPIPATVTRNGVNLEKDISADSRNDGVNGASIENDGDHDASCNLSPQDDSQSLRLEHAATKAQAAFRGYLARRAFRTLKGIIRLQALICGNLVRRQAVATLCSAWGIVKFQALVRGQKVRRTDIAIEVQKIYLSALPVAKSSCELSASARVKNLSNNAIVRKLLSLSPTVLPLRLQYGPGEPNSAREWLDRWMRLCFWEPPQPIRSLTSKSQVKVEHIEHGQGKTKRTSRKLSNGKVENGSNRSTSENEKHRRNPRKVSTNPADQVQEQPQNEIEKVKRHLRKIPDSTKEISGRAEVKTEIPNQTLKKTSASSVVDVFEGNSAEKRNVVSVALAKPSNLEANPKLSTANDSVEESNTTLAVDSKPTESNRKVKNMPATDEQFSSKDGVISSENLNKSQRRASFPGKIDYKENGLYSTPKVPSYMAPTESVKAKLRGQGSPRFSRDVIEKNGVTRRHSLPSATDSNLSSLSPQAQILVQAVGKGAMRNDKSLSASRDAGDKGIKADWRR